MTLVLIGLLGANAAVFGGLLPGAGRAGSLAVDVGAATDSLVGEVSERAEDASRSAVREQSGGDDGALPTVTGTAAVRTDLNEGSSSDDEPTDDATAPSARKTSSPSTTGTRTVTSSTPTRTATTSTATTASTSTSAPTSAPTTSTATTTTAPPGSLTAQALSLINAERATAGCTAPLKVDATLVAAAEAHLADMLANEYFSHTGMDGSTPMTRAQAAGYTGTAVEETFGAGFTDASSIVDAWMADPQERAKLLDCAKVDTGIGYDVDALPPPYGPGTWVQLVGS